MVWPQLQSLLVNIPMTSKACQQNPKSRSSVSVGYLWVFHRATQSAVVAGGRYPSVKCCLAAAAIKQPPSGVLRQVTMLEWSTTTLGVCERYFDWGCHVDLCVCVFDCPGHFQHTGQGRAACGADH